MATSQASRDWLKTLWPASFKGVPFFFEQDKEEGGRGLVVHSFPNRDDPFVEDLGEEPRVYSGSAYVHGDSADALATALKAALASRGAGMLVVPYFGPVTVHCQSFERATQRDQMGYVAFELKFVRKGAASGLISVPLLQNVGFVAADKLAATVSVLFPQAIVTLGQPDHVIAAAADTLASAAAAIEVLRQGYPTAPAASAKLRDEVAGLITDVPDAINDGLAPGDAARALAARLIQTVRDLGSAMPAPSARQAALALAASFPSAHLVLNGTPYQASSARASVNAEAAARVARLAGLTAYAEAVLRTTFTSRPDGVTARGEVAERFEAELYDTTGAGNAALYLAIDQLRNAVINWLTRVINDLAPVITVESASIRPSLDLAWVLYADPTRAAELVARNNVRHPSFVPRVIEALAR
ncbi:MULTISPECIES: DNA circularization N-terminal domain-containing protein [unclassified Bradyrhizobium]|uniref:DNA circularization N-terminal domain-containing protein n=1 Tax=unclassified Bradyrhizobium TaxID=2631580 RepID=UPI002915C54B|nr:MULTISPECIES: DNA circularization N-terminal domain-containing protein [unclassified Bradyrhizobium]